MTRRILLRYSAEKASKPILSEIIRETGVLVNLLYANIDTGGGEILISVDANRADEIFQELSKRGIEFQEIKGSIEVDWDSCVHCGACVSLCPTRALHMKENASLGLDDDKCVLCEICVSACPVRALRLPRF